VFASELSIFIFFVKINKLYLIVSLGEKPNYLPSSTSKPSKV